MRGQVLIKKTNVEFCQIAYKASYVVFHGFNWASTYCVSFPKIVKSEHKNPLTNFAFLPKV